MSEADDKVFAEWSRCSTRIADLKNRLSDAGDQLQPLGYALKHDPEFVEPPTETRDDFLIIRAGYRDRPTATRIPVPDFKEIARLLFELEEARRRAARLARRLEGTEHAHSVKEGGQRS